MMPMMFSSKTGGQAATSFNPQTQGTLVNWYDSSTLAHTDGDGITTFPDSKAGNPNPLTAVFAPIFHTPQQNGLGTVLYNSSSMQGGSSASTFPYTLVAVVKMTTTAGGQAILGPAENNGGMEFGMSSGSPFMNAADIANIGTATSSISTGAYHLIVATVDASTYAFYIDGVAAGSGTHSVSLTGGMHFEMGNSKNGEDYLFAYIGEIQIYSSVLSSGDLSALHTYIVNKWATP